MPEEILRVKYIFERELFNLETKAERKIIMLKFDCYIKLKETLYIYMKHTSNENHQSGIGFNTECQLCIYIYIYIYIYIKYLFRFQFSRTFQPSCCTRIFIFQLNSKYLRTLVRDSRVVYSSPDLGKLLPGTSNVFQSDASSMLSTIRRDSKANEQT